MNEKLFYDQVNNMLKDDKGRDVFIAIIWPTAVSYSEQILSSIKQYDGLELVKRKKIIMTKTELSAFMQVVYKYDWISEKIVAGKCNEIVNRLTDDSVELMLLCFVSEKTEYVINKKNNTIQAKNILDTKKYIRDEIKPLIPNYVHDIIIHISDDGKQTKAIIDLLSVFEMSKMHCDSVRNFSYENGFLYLHVNYLTDQYNNLGIDWLKIVCD